MDNTTTTTTPSSDDTITMSPIINKLNEEETDNFENMVNNNSVTTGDESYRTPTSKESKIPEVLSCPPAPKKPKSLVSCKRKLMDEFQFFEDTNKEDMDEFFRSTFPKRSCSCK
ncbi:hypothetical protein TanjilG_17652 [Lupinus angustifolius]|uniref:Uncharacterized protein n=1 Tax=Lupinus angustifolius TaxID=3871 RepID=A0A1J7IE95_LUPAN|nr:PREDICTED: cyclin-dependent protein kinase inhibitor SMR2-like [Lupinus angustifolius]OIW13209.1 hypothetical protein TanjilG_17652 [Lupinus angustifolius]